MKKRGFTLIELLATIIILALIGLIVYPTLNNVISSNRDRLYNKQIEELIRLTNEWVIDNNDKINNSDIYLLTFDEMHKDGLLSNNTVKNPKTNEDLPGCMKITTDENGLTEIEYSKDCSKRRHCIDLEHPNPQPGDTFIDGQYVYRYKLEKDSDSDTGWKEIETDGWWVGINDMTATKISTPLCSTVNEKPIVSMNFMFIDFTEDLIVSEATSVDLSSFDTSNVTNMIGMFYNCKIPTLDLSNFDTSKVTNMHGMFFGAEASSINFSNLNTSNVTDMGYMFYGTKTPTLDLSNFDTSNVTNMSYMFYENQATSLNLSSFNTSKVTNMSRMFDDSQATSINLSSFDTSKVTSMSSMFYNTKVDTLDLSSFDTSNVTSMNFMFSGSKATTGYARTQGDADRFNVTTGKPSTLTFTVK